MEAVKYTTAKPKQQETKSEFKPKFNEAMLPISNFIERADAMKESWGVTTLYSSGDLNLNEYLGGSKQGALGRKNGYEMVLIYGDTGKGKSTLGLNLVADAIKKGVKVGLMILEDDPADVVNRLRLIVGPEIDKANNVFFVADQSEGYTLDQALKAVELWFEQCDLILLDHLEYLWKGSVGQSERDKWTAQEIWMRRLNTLMKKNKKTIIMIQHTNKGGKDTQGMNKIMGSSSLQQTATKVIEFGRLDDGASYLRLWKTRFTPYRDHTLRININKFKISVDTV